MIKVGVLGVKGRMGSTVAGAVAAADGMTVAAAVDAGDDRESLAGCDVVVDFTHPAEVMDNLSWCVGHGLDCVVGTSGFDEARLAELAGLLGGAPARVLVAPNFSIGAVLMMHFATQAARPSAMSAASLPPFLITSAELRMSCRLVSIRANSVICSPG